MTEKLSTKADLSFWNSGKLGKQSSGEERLLFGQVREDATVEVNLLKKRPQAKQVFAIASGGCTALSLLAAGEVVVHAVDINPTQIYLTELKARILGQLSLQEVRTAFCQNATDAYLHTRTQLSPEADSFWRDHRSLLQKGLNNSGWIDQNIQRMVGLFFAFVHPRTEVEEFLLQTDPDRQRQSFATWCNWQWNLSLSIAFSRPFLALGFGKAAIESLPADFASIMRARLERAFTSFPCAQNGYLWQTFLGRYPEDEAAMPIFLRAADHLLLQTRLPDNLKLYCADAVGWLQQQPAQSIDLFALSNILEIVKSDYGEFLQKEIARTARPGAYVCTRSIFPRAGAVFKDLPLEAALSSQMEKIDRSFFCNSLQIYALT